jgi:hypothetical protein
MENENNILTEEQKVAIAINAGATQLESIIDNFDDCVNVENVVNQFNAEENIFKFQHKSGRVYRLQQQVYAHSAGSAHFQIIWGLVECSMNDTNYNLTNMRRHGWVDWLADKSITDERQQYFWFRFHGKRLSNAAACMMEINVFDDGTTNVTCKYDKDYINEMLSDTGHLAENIKQKDLKSDANYISGNHKRKQMMEVVNSVMAIEGPAQCIVDAFDKEVFNITQTVEKDSTVLFDEVNLAKVVVTCKAVLPAFENRVAFNFRYKMTVNTQDYTAKCNDEQEVDLNCNNAQFEVQQIYHGTMPFVIKFDLMPNKEKYTQSKWRDYVTCKLSEFKNVNPSTGKSFIQEYTEGYKAMKPISDAVKTVC